MRRAFLPCAPGGHFPSGCCSRRVFKIEEHIMRNGRGVIFGAFTVVLAAVAAVVAFSRGAGAQDAIQEAQTPRPVQATRPEQQKTEHDRSDAFSAAKAPRSSTALESQ